MKKILLSVFIIAVAGCANKDASQTAKNDGYQCEKITHAGTAIPKKICTTSKQRKDMEEDAKKIVLKARDSSKVGQ